MFNERPFILVMVSGQLSPGGKYGFLNKALLPLSQQQIGANKSDSGADRLFCLVRLILPLHILYGKLGL